MENYLENNIVATYDVGQTTGENFYYQNTTSICPCCQSVMYYVYEIIKQDAFGSEYRIGYRCNNCHHDETYVMSTFSTYPYTADPAWQLCPKCEGDGRKRCRICNDKGIINKLTGLPPVD